MADVSSYDSTIPSGNSEIRLGDDTLRSRGSDMHAAWTEEHFFRDGSAASGGQHKLGSSRVSYQQQAAPLSGDKGRIHYDETTNVLAVQSSSDTTAIGNPCAAGVLESAILSIPSGSDSSVTFNKALFDRGGFINFSGNSAHKMDVQREGIYRVDSEVGWGGSGVETGAGSGTSTYRHSVTQNSNEVAQAEFVDIGGHIDNTQASVVTKASAGDSFSARVFHEENSSHNILSAHLSIEKIG